MYQVEDIIIQRIMHSSVKMKLQFFLQLCYYFLLHKMYAHFIMCLAPIVQSYIYIDIYMREIYSVLLRRFLFCWIKLFSKLLLPVMSVNYCNGLAH